MSEAPGRKATERVVYLNGEIIPESEARLSIFDRGFIWGDAVYDAGRTFAGRPYACGSTYSACTARCAIAASTWACPRRTSTDRAGGHRA